MYDFVVSIYVLKSLLRRRETFRKKYGAAFWEIAKKYGFFTSKKKASPRGCFWTKIYKISNLKVDFFQKNVTSQNSKIAQIYFTWSLSVPSFKKIGEPHKKKKINK